MLLSIILWSLAILAVSWHLLPSVLHFLRLYSYRLKIVPIATDMDPELRRMADELMALGFQPLGDIQQSAWIAAGGWHHRQRFHVLGSNAQEAFASLWQYYPHELPRVIVTTWLPDGSLVRTTTWATDMPSWKLPGYVMQAVASEDLFALFAVHRQAVRSRDSHALPRRNHEDLNVLVAAVLERLPTDVSQLDYHLIPHLFHATLVTCGVALLLAYGLGEAHPIIAVAALAGSGVWQLYLYWTTRQARILRLRMRDAEIAAARKQAAARS